MTADEWNALHPVGTRVLVYPGAVEAFTASSAWTYIHTGKPVVLLDDRPGPVSLAFIEPLKED